MKITGKNSVATIVKWTFLLCFLFIAFHLVYFFIGYGIASYKLSGNSEIFGNSITLGTNAIGLNPLNSFQINYPFTDQNFMFGEFSWETFLMNALGFGALTFYFYTLYRIFDNLSTTPIFSNSILIWLKVFVWTNFSIGVVYFIVWNFTYETKTLKVIFTAFPFVLIGTICLFAYDFFKKGYQLQSENDLTI